MFITVSTGVAVAILFRPLRGLEDKDYEGGIKCHFCAMPAGRKAGILTN